MTTWWNREVGEVTGAVGSSAEFGLTAAEAAGRFQKHGPNELKQKKGVSPLALFLDQFKDFIVWVLIGAALVSGLLKEWVDAVAIIAIVILNSILGFIQEFRAEKALAALKKMSSPNSKAIRDGHLQLIPSSQLVPGDLIELEAGDHIPADARVAWTSANLSVQEASLTGESTAVAKTAAALDKDEVPLADRVNMVYMGTSVAMGKGRALVVETGMQTELGKIAGMIQDIEHETTPLQKRLEEFGKWIVYLCLVLVSLVFVVGFAREGKAHLLELFLTSVSLAVAAIPEGLPAVVTIALALGVQRMVKRHALIRKLPSVETLGCATVICSDKTGTLTKNEMTVQALFADGKLFRLTGIGYEPTGEYAFEGKTVSPAAFPGLRNALTCGVLCNGAQLRSEEGQWKVAGDPTEGALLTAAAKAGMTRKDLEGRFAFVNEIPFDSDRKQMTMLRRTPDGRTRAYVKGAPDVLLANCTRIEDAGVVRPLTDADRQAILRVNNELADQAMRVLALASRDIDTLPEKLEAAAVETDLVFAGLAAMIDPPREEVKMAMRECQRAGIRTVMITGDHKNTAVAIARQLGFFKDDSVALTGAELDQVSEKDFQELVTRVPVYARVSPEHKLRIVRTWRNRGEVVAMTGDGVNDAPAVKEADIGVAMGITGTDVTKEVSDMVVTDDNFASIVSAVEEGRGIYDNIKKFIHYLLSCNAGEILVMFVASLIGLPMPLLPIHILWVNLVTDGLPALALGVDPVDKNIMSRKPRRKDEKIVDRSNLFLMVFQGLVIATGCLAAFSYVYYIEDRHSLGEVLRAVFDFDFSRLAAIFTVDEAMREQVIGRARTVAFVVLAFSQDFHSYNCRNQTESLFKIGFFTNPKLVGATLVSMTLNALAIYSPFFQGFLKTQPLSFHELMVVIALASFPLWVMEVLKLVRKLKR